MAGPQQAQTHPNADCEAQQKREGHEDV
jgi:hypothetical protein